MSIRRHLLTCVILVAVSAKGTSGRLGSEIAGGFQRTFAVPGPVSIEIVAGSGDISLRVGEPGKLEITAKIAITSWDDNQPDHLREIEVNPPVTRNGDAFRIGYLANQAVARGLSISYVIVAPPGTRVRSRTSSGAQIVNGVASVEATSGSGDLHVWDIEGKVVLRTGSGNVDLRSAHGDVNITAGTGSIIASGVFSDSSSLDANDLSISTGSDGRPISIGAVPLSIQISTGSGDVDLEDVDAGIGVMTGSGNIAVSGLPTSNWHLYTGSGSIRARLPAIVNCTIHAHTDSGDIEAQRQMKLDGLAGTLDFEGQIGHGGAVVDLTTASGDIRIE